MSMKHEIRLINHMQRLGQPRTSQCSGHLYDYVTFVRLCFNVLTLETSGSDFFRTGIVHISLHFMTSRNLLRTLRRSEQKEIHLPFI